MAVDRGYGSGRSRSAANSSARRRAAEGKMTKGKKGGITSAQFKAMQAKQAASPLGQAADFLLGFALPTGKVATAAGMLLGKGKLGTAATMAQRLASKDYGRAAGKEIAKNIKIPKMGQQAAQDSYERVSDLVRSGKVTRSASEGVFPRAAKNAKPVNLTELFKSGQWASKPVGYKGPKMSSAEEMAILQKASRGTRAGRGGIRGIRAGQKKAE